MHFLLLRLKTFSIEMLKITISTTEKLSHIMQSLWEVTHMPEAFLSTTSKQLNEALENTVLSENFSPHREKSLIFQ